MITEKQMGKLLTECYAPYPNLVLKLETVVEMTSLFKDCLPQTLKTAFQNAMFGSGDFFPGPGRVMEEYRALVEKSDGQEQTKEWNESPTGRVDLVITTVRKSEKGVPETERRTYVDMSKKALWEARKLQYAKGMRLVIEKVASGGTVYSYIKYKEGQHCSYLKDGGFITFEGESLPVLQVIPRSGA